MAQTYNRGTVVLIEVEIKKRAPFGGEALFDPTSATITIRDPMGSAVISAAELTKNSTGQYYYICSTGESWLTGHYSATITLTDSGLSDITELASCFYLT